MTRTRKAPSINWERGDDGKLYWVQVSDRLHTIDDAEAELVKQQVEMEAEAVDEADFTGLSVGAEEGDYSESDSEITRRDEPPRIGEWRTAVGKADYTGRVPGASGGGKKPFIRNQNTQLMPIYSVRTGD